MQQFENVIDIKAFLPHREPMLMVDYIFELSSQNVKTFLEIKQENIFVNQNGFFEEAGLIENAAQTCSAIVGQTFFVDENGSVLEDIEVIGFISGIKKVKLYALPKVGEQIITSCVLESRFDAEGYSICSMICTTTRDEETLFEAEINLFIQEKK